MSRIKQAFAQGKALIPFLTCGDPDLDTTESAARAMARAGADLIGLGIPFSDPTSEDPVIQASNGRALAAGVTTEKIFRMVRRLRRDVRIPLVFMAYANVVFSYGVQRFAQSAADVGVDGLIFPDVPTEEKEEFALACRQCCLDLISLIAPASERRISSIARQAEGFLYCVAALGGNSVDRGLTADVAGMVRLAKAANPGLPCAVGAGISTPEQAAAMAALSDGAIVDSAIVRLLEQYGQDAPPRLAEYVAGMKGTL